jgi:ribosomal protein S27AE
MAGQVNVELTACPGCGEISAARIAGRLQCSECGWMEAASEAAAGGSQEQRPGWAVARDGIAVPPLPGMAVEDPRKQLRWTPAETYRQMKALDPNAILYLSVCCGREQTHSGPTRFCAFCGRECVGDVYEPSPPQAPAMPSVTPGEELS